MKKLSLLLSIFVLLYALSIRTAFGDMPLESTRVSYVVSSSVSYNGPLEQISFDVDVTLQCETTYNGSVYGEFPSPNEHEPAICHLEVAPYSGILTVDYHIDRPALPDLGGSKSIPLPLRGQYILGDSPSIIIPITVDTTPVGTIIIVIHGHLFGDISLNSTHHVSLEWSTWETQELTILSNAPTVLLTMGTTYKVYFTVTVSVGTFDVVTVDSPTKDISGDPSIEYVIPEFPSLIAWLSVIGILTAMILLGSKRFMRTKPEKYKINLSNSCFVSESLITPSR